MDTLLDRAKKRCQDCFALVERNNKWHCDEAGLPIEQVPSCKEWTDSKIANL